MSVIEESPAGTVVGQVSTLSNYMYTFQDPTSPFEISSSGTVRTLRVIDREALPNPVIRLLVNGKPNNPQDKQVTFSVAITVLDINDNFPVFNADSGTQTISFQEDIREGRKSIATATDPDEGINGTVKTYEIVGGNEASMFGLDSSGLPLILYIAKRGSESFDREKLDHYLLNISAQDGGNPPKYGYLSVKVVVLDVNDNTPAFDLSQYKTQVNESAPVGSLVFRAEATDSDIGLNAQIVYHLEDQTNQFKIDENTGEIRTVTSPLICKFRCNRSTDPCSSNSCFTIVEATDKGLNPLTGRAYLYIEVLDENDHDPVITFSESSNSGITVANVGENANLQTVVFTVSVTDVDSGLNGETTLSIIRGNEDGYFSYYFVSNVSIGWVRVAKQLDRETIDRFNITFKAVDKGTPPRSSTAHIVILVNDANDHSPEFEHSDYRVSLSEFAKPHSFVASIRASDKDEGINAQLTYEIAVGNNPLQWFSIDPDTGLVTTVTSIDHEEAAQVVLNISSRDGGSDPKYSYATLIIDIQDENDYTPRFSQDVYNSDLMENLPANSEIVNVKATDSDSGINGTIEFLIHPDTQMKYPDLFSIQSSGRVTTLKIFDREERDRYTIKVIARDKGPNPLSSTATIQLTIKDVNDNRPKFLSREYYVNIFDNDSAGQPVIKVSASDKDMGDFGKVTYSMVDTYNSFRIQPDTGVISTSRVLLRQPYKLTVSAKDGGDLTAESDATVNVIVITMSSTAPEFSALAYVFEIDEDDSEHTPNIGRQVGTVLASSLAGRTIIYAITGGDQEGVFKIDSSSGRIRTQLAVDREEKAEYNLTVIGFDGERISLRKVTVTVKDLNDNAPVFVTDTTEALVMENWPVGHNVFFAQAVDKDDGNNRELSYSLTSRDDTNSVFAINASTGVIYLAKPSDQMPTTSVTLTITATDAGATHKSSSMSVKVKIEDVNDHTPMFDEDRYELFLSESQPVNQVVSVLSAMDGDKGPNAELNYGIIRGNEDRRFGIFPDGSLYVAHELDREKKAMYSLTVAVHDNGKEPRSSAVNITIYVEDENDNKPEFTRDLFEFSFRENQNVSTFVGTVQANDEDIGRNSEIIYSLGEGNVNFSIDPILGTIFSNREFDREYIVKTTSVPYYVFDVYATDNGVVKLQSKASVKVNILDENDNPPVFVLAADTTIGVSEHSNVNDTVFTLLAVDADEGANAAVTYTIVKGNEDAKFGVQPATGQLYLRDWLDREMVDNYKLTVKATDTGAYVQLSATINLNIIVLDYNDNAPEFDMGTPTNISIIESTPIGDTLVTFTGIDRDIGISATIRFDIVSGNTDDVFALGVYSGRLSLSRMLDYEATNRIALNITLSDAGFPSLSVARTLVVNVIDANDNAPAFTDGFTQLYFIETIPPKTRIATVNATDKDSGDYGTVRYSLYKQSPSGSHFSINSTTGEITLSRTLDRETYESFRLTIQAIDQDPNISRRRTAEKSLTIIVQDANDNAPFFQSSRAFLVPYPSSVGTAVASVYATDPDAGENGKVSYSFSGQRPPLFSLNLTSGTITLTSALSLSQFSYPITITATDGGFSDVLGPKSSTDTITLLIYTSTGNGPTFSPTSPSTASVTENVSRGTTIMRVEAAPSAADLGVDYYITQVKAAGKNQGGLFTINQSSGVIITAAAIDREAIGVDILTVDITAVESGGNGQRATTQQVTIRVDDVNDNPPEFSSTLFDASVSENIPPGTSVMRVFVNDPDITGTLTLTLKGASANKFRIVQNGTIYLTQQLDYEAARSHDLSVDAFDGVQTASALLRINVIDENDNNPVFGRAFYTFDIAENSDTGYVIGRLLATDADSGNNGYVIYEITSQWGQDYFQLDNNRGTFTLIKALDFEERQLYTLRVVAKDQGSQPRSAEVVVYMNVKDVNDNQPTFDPMSYYKEVLEDASVLTILVNVSATDIDSGLNGVVRYSLLGNYSSKFAIGPINGSIYTVASLDREQVALYNVIVMATDQAPNAKDRLYTTATVQIKLKDVNDNPPVFTSPTSVQVREDAKLNTTVFTLTVQDLDEGVNSQITFRLVSQTSSGTFTVDPKTGAIVLKSQLDRETISNHTLVIEAKDGGSPQRSSQQTLVVQVSDANDNPPVFTQSRYNKTVNEDVAIGTSLLRIMANDRDVGLNGAVRYFIIGGEGSNDFNLDISSGVLRVQKALDYERIQSYTISIQAEDSSVENRLQTNATIVISLNDVNDFVPVFDNSPYITFVQEGMPNGPVPIITVTARDEDSGDNGMVIYSLRDITNYTNMFDVDSISGQVVAKKTLDREAVPFYILTIAAMDRGTPVQMGTATVTVFVKDVNDHGPVFDSNGPYLANIMENMAPDTAVIIVSATDTDEGMNAQIVYTLSDNMDSKFYIHPGSAQISTTVSLDREVEAMYSLTVIATDQGIPPRSASVQVTVMVGDDNDHAPEFGSSSYTTMIYDSANTGDFVIGVTAVDQDIGKNGKVVYTLEGANLSLFRINDQTGVVTLASSLTSLGRSFNFIVRASDLGETPLNSSVTVSVNLSPTPSTNRPRFNDTNLGLRIKENADIGSLLTTVHATTTTNSRITYFIAGGNVNNGFAINSETGNITVAGGIDFEVTNTLTLWIEARDQGSTQLSTFKVLNITVEDENDNDPMFSSSLYNASVPENSGVGTQVYTVRATDLDSGDNAQLQYFIKSGNDNNTFQLDATSGVLSTLNRVVDREKIALYNLEIQASDMGKPKRNATTTVRVSILDLNDNAPVFVGMRSVAVPEDLPVGTLIMRLTTVDADIGANARANYSLIITDETSFPFAINPTTGVITNTRRLDAETQERFSFPATVTDGAFMSRTTLTIRILDVNDNHPIFKDSTIIIEFTELQLPNTRVNQLTAVDYDISSPNNQFFFSLRRPSSLFQLNSETGEIVALETMRFYGGQSSGDTMNDQVLDVLVTDLGIPSLSSEATVKIRITDANDHAPVFEKDRYFTAVPRNLNISQQVIKVTAVDLMDFGKNAEVVYSITGGNGANFFAVNSASGEIFSNASLAGNVQQKLILSIRAMDRGLPPQNSSVNVELYVTEPNVNVPRFNSNPFQKQIREDLAVGSVIDTITATDNDAGLNGEIEYLLTGGNDDGMFSIGLDTGQLKVQQALDYETQTFYIINITARDKALYSKEVTKSYKILLQDVNDNKPMFDRDYYDAYIQENSIQFSPVMTITATDADATAINKDIRYDIVGDATSKTYFQVNNMTGQISTGASVFDYETRTLYTLLVMAYNPAQGNGDSPILKSVTTVYIHVTGENEDSPRFLVKLYSFQVIESAEMGKSIGRVTAVDKDHGVDGVVYYYLEAQSNLRGFSVDPLTGDIKVSKRPDYESSPIVSLTVIAKNWGSVLGNDTDTCIVNVTVIDANDPPEFSKAVYYANVTENSVGSTFVTYVYAEDKDTLPENRLFKYEIISGNVPERFIISQTGRIETSGLGVLDRETTAKYALIIGAKDTRDPSILGTATVEIELLDVNDNGPRFNPENLRANVSENMTSGLDVIVLKDYTVDADLPPNQGPYRYRPKDGPWSEFFSINEQTGRVQTTKVLNRNSNPQFVVAVVVTDGGTPTMTSTLSFTIVVNDINDSQPKPRPLTLMVNVRENESISGKIADVQPLDSDLTDRYKCTIVSGDAAHFVINNECDLEAVNLGPETYKLRIQGSDEKHVPVVYDVFIVVETLSNNSLISSVATELVNEKASTFLERKYSVFKSKVQEAFGSFVTCKIYSLREVGSNLYVTMYAFDNNKRLLSSSDVQRGLTSAKGAIEVSADVSIQTVAVGRCAVNPCKNGGVCSTVIAALSGVAIVDSPSLILTSPNTDLSTSCFCPPELTGPFCEQSQQPCGADYCYNGGMCIDNVCKCPDNWQGAFCQNDVNECLLGSPCKNGATCRNTNGSFECDCADGFKGRYCDSQNFCASRPCSTHGVCEELLDSFQCRCDYGYHGSRCQFSSMSFQEGSYALFDAVDNYRTFNVTMYFATVSTSALLMFSPVNQGYIAVEIVKAKVQASFLLEDTNQVKLTTTASVNTGYWYRLELTKIPGTANLIVQKCPNLTCDNCGDKQGDCYSEANYATSNIPLTGSYISIGGIKNFSDIIALKGKVSSHDFVGCVHSVVINSKALDHPPREAYNVTDTCPRSQSISLCVGNQDSYGHSCNNGFCVDKWSHTTCKCPSNYMDDACIICKQPFTLGSNAKVQYKLRPSYVKDSQLSALAASQSRRRRAVAQNTLLMRFRSAERQGVLFSSRTDSGSCLLWFTDDGIHFLIKSNDAVNDPLTVPVSDITDSSWHNVTVSEADSMYTLTFDDKDPKSKSFGIAYSFDSPNLLDMVVGGPATVPDNSEIKGFQGCLSQFLINGELLPLNGSTDKYTINVEGSVDGSCAALCNNNPCGGKNKCIPVGEVHQCMLVAPESAGLETGIIIVIVFFGILLIAIVVVFVLFRTRRDLFQRCVRNNKQNRSLGSASSSGKINVNADVISAGGMNGSGSRYALNPSEEEMIIRNHIAENLTGQKASSLSSRPDLIGSSYSPQPVQLSDGTVIMETSSVMNNLLGEEDVPEHYDFENASSIAPSDIAPSDMIRHYRDFRNGTHHHHHHHHHHPPLPQSQPLNNHLFNKYRASPNSGHLNNHGIRQSPISLSGSALSVPANGNQAMAPNGGRPSSALAALNHPDPGRSRMSPLTQLNVRSPRTHPHNYSTNNISRSNSIGSHHSHSSSSSATGVPNGHIPPHPHSPHKPFNNKLSAVRGRAPKGLTVEDVNRLNARPDLTDPVSLMEVASSSVDGRQKGYLKHRILPQDPVLDSSLLLEPPDSSSSDSGANDSFTCSEFEYDNDNARTRLDLDPGKMIFSKLAEVENETDDFGPLHQNQNGKLGSGSDGFNSNGDSFASTNPSSSGSPASPQQQFPIGSQYDFDALLNWGPNFDKLVGVFKDIAQLPDTGQKLEGATDHDYEEYV
ncbi:unnamed protein product [Lymnaea stagnalis]|uniref:Uncharacterized protein n=1 Tax=Lymnaea stagnalis TaxID=6523 RepID=A0AAV2HNJ3_LYMST